MAELLPVPEVAAGATEVTLTEWLLKVGDTFAAGDLIAVIETDKAAVEMAAEQAGTLLRTLVEDGSRIEVGAPMALIGGPADDGADVDRLLRDLGVAGAGVAGVQTHPQVEASASQEQPADDLPSFESDDPVTLPGTALPTGGAPGGTDRVFASPIARKLLKDAGLTTEGINGSGPHGRIRRRDVETAIAAAATARTTGYGSAAPAAAAPSQAPATAPVARGAATAPRSPGSWTDVPHTRLRRAIATRLTRSKQETPHFYLRRSVDLDALLALRASVNEDSPVRVSVNDFLLRAVAAAYVAVPEANVIWTEDATRRFDSVDIAVAIASDRGLVTPVLRRVEEASLSSVARQVRGYVDKANSGKLQQHELEGGSITVSNLGMFGVDEFSAIINPPHSAILAVGAARPTVVVRDGASAVATCANLVLSVDHRAVDGALAAQFMAALVEAVERPMRLVV